VTRSVTFTVVGIAQPKGSTKAFVPRGWTRPVVTSDNPRAKDWQHCVSMTAQSVAGDGLFLGPVALRVSFALPRPASLPKRVVGHVRKPDVDKLLRAVGDALTGVLYRDDAQVVELHARKGYAEIGTAPQAEITVVDAGPFAVTSMATGWLFEEA
jgi:crossover junction endodeoxyribonuclease RusA